MNKKPTYEELEKKVKELENELTKFKFIAENSNDYIGFRDSSGKLVYSTSSFIESLGYSNQDYLDGKITMKDYVHPDDYELVFEKFQLAMKGEEIAPLEYKAVSKNNEIRNLSVSSKPFWHNNKFEGLLASIKDITEQKNSDISLQESEEKYRNLFDSIPASIAIMTDGEVIDCNNYYMNFFGLENKSERIGKRLDKFYPDYQPNGERSLDEAKKHIELALKKGIHIFEWLSKNKNGKLIMFEIQLSSYKVRDKNYIMSIGWDISDRKKTEHSMEEYSKELKKHIDDKDRFISILAHDLRSPFNSILGFSNLLLRNINKYDKEKIEIQARILNQAVHKVFHLLEDLLFWISSQSGKMLFEPKMINLNELCIQQIEHIKTHANTKDITIHFFESDVIEAYADKNMFKSILRNLILNAVKFTHRKGMISIHLEKNPQNSIITVSDTGIGINKDDIPKLWTISEKFSTEGTEGEQGTGLGLLLCKEFVEKHEGKIWVESEPGKGSAFKFLLPAKLF